MPESVYLVEEESELRSTLSHLLQTLGYDVTPFSCGTLALENIQHASPDLVVLDTKLPDLNGFELLKSLREQTDCLVLLLSPQAAESDCILGLQLGGDDFLAKPFSLREFASRIKALFRRLERQESPSQTPPGRSLSYRTLALDIDRKTVRFQDRSTPLTFSEYSILRRMMADPKRVFTRQELLEAPVVYRGGDSRAADMHIVNLRRKIDGLKPGFRILQSIRGVGYRLQGCYE